MKSKGNNKQRLFEMMGRVNPTFKMKLNEDHDYSHDKEEIEKKHLEKQKEIQGIWDDEKELLALRKSLEDLKKESE